MLYSARYDGSQKLNYNSMNEKNKTPKPASCKHNSWCLSLRRAAIFLLGRSFYQSSRVGYRSIYCLYICFYSVI